MKTPALRLMFCLCLLLGSPGGHSQSGESLRIAAAERLFDLSAYTKLASRQIFETVNNLPPEQRQAAQQALKDPAVLAAMRQVIIRAMAGTYGVKELEFLHKVFSAPEMDTFVRREALFRDQLQREFTAALLTNPALIRRIPPPRTN